jgi:predicted phage tail protein
VIGEVGYTSSVFRKYSPANPSESFYRSVFYNNTPIVDETDRKNFQSVNVAWTNGSPVGKALSTSEIGLGGSSDNLEVVRNISERLRGPDSTFRADYTTSIKAGQDTKGRDNAKLYQIANKNIKGFKVNVKVNQLGKTEVTGPSAGAVVKGDSKGTSITYRIDYRPVYNVKEKNLSFRKDGDWIELNPVTETIYGKISSGYIRSTRVLIADTSIFNDPDLIGWEIMVYRETLESFKSSLRNQSFVDTIVEIYDESYVYPNAAIIKHKFRADAFNAIPSRSFKVRLLKVKIPNNYNPILRTYGATRGGSAVTNGGDASLNNFYDSSGSGQGVTSEIWNGDWKRNSDGTIKYEWTNNPAWVYFDLLTNPRYGLGKRIQEKDVDKWTLFVIAKYCDELVFDEYGGLEPRFTANIYINTQEEAYSVINSFASIFRGISIYFGGQIKIISDKPQDPIYTFSNSNVVE